MHLAEMPSGNFLKLAGVLACMIASLRAGDFAPPAEGPVAFRRDKLPLEISTLSSLSEDLVNLAAGLDLSSAVNRRVAAQMLALAKALDPGNARARDLIHAFAQASPTPSAKRQDLEHLRTNIQQLISWLETPEAGSDGQALAACLKDVMAQQIPKNPHASGKGERELGAWAGWIPPLSSYEKMEPPTPTPLKKTETMPPRGIPLPHAAVRLLAWTKNPLQDGPRWIYTPARLEMTAQQAEPAEDGQPKLFSLIDESGALANQLPTIESHLKPLSPPSGWTVTLRSEALVASKVSKKPLDLSAAATVLASAAISGREPDAMILGTLDEKGAFLLPQDFWEQLRVLENGPGGRLVLPSKAADYLPSFLAMENPAFFLKYEIFFAKNLEELVNFSEKTLPESLAGASSRFQEICDKAGSQPLGPYLSNPYVRRRLAEIIQEVPSHGSARMLALQGAGKRPTKIPRAILVAEIRHALDPMAWMSRWSLLKPSGNLDIATVPKLAPTYEACHSRLEMLRHVTDKGDLSLFASADQVVTSIRSLERSIARSRGSIYDAEDIKTQLDNDYWKAIKDLNRATQELISQP